jgi:hypothetical protein
MIWISYVVIDYTSLSKERKSSLNLDYRESLYPGDGKISGFEYIFFYLVCPFVSVILLLEMIQCFRKKGARDES